MWEGEEKAHWQQEIIFEKEMNRRSCSEIFNAIFVVTF